MTTADKDANAGKAWPTPPLPASSVTVILLRPTKLYARFLPPCFAIGMQVTNC